MPLGKLVSRRFYIKLIKKADRIRVISVSRYSSVDRS